MQLPIIPYRGWRKPTGIPIRTRQHPLVRAPLCAYVPSGGAIFDICGVGPALRPSSASQYGNCQEGYGTNHIAASGLYSATIPTVLQNALSGASTVFFRGSGPFTASGAATYFGLLPNNTFGSPFFVNGFQAQNTTGQVQFLANSAGSLIGFSSANGALTAGGHSIATTLQPSGNLTGYIDAKNLGTSAAASAPTFSATAQISWGGTVGSATNYINGVGLVGYIFPYALTAFELLVLHLDPYALLVYPEDDIFAELVAAGGGPTLVTLAQASWAWGGNPIGVNQRTDLALIQKAWNWTGNAPGVDQRTGLTLVKAAWAWSGTPLGVNAKQMPALPSKTWAWGTSPMGVDQRTALTLMKATWAWTGIALTVSTTTFITLAQAVWRWEGNPFPNLGPKFMRLFADIASKFGFTFEPWE